jgi:hypothetical protein
LFADLFYLFNRSFPHSLGSSRVRTIKRPLAAVSNIRLAKAAGGLIIVVTREDATDCEKKGPQLCYGPFLTIDLRLKTQDYGLTNGSPGYQPY